MLLTCLQHSVAIYFSFTIRMHIIKVQRSSLAQYTQPEYIYQQQQNLPNFHSKTASLLSSPDSIQLTPKNKTNNNTCTPIDRCLGIIPFFSHFIIRHSSPT